jgi:hypothetical protein
LIEKKKRIRRDWWRNKVKEKSDCEYDRQERIRKSIRRKGRRRVGGRKRRKEKKKIEIIWREKTIF